MINCYITIKIEIYLNYFKYKINLNFIENKKLPTNMYDSFRRLFDFEIYIFETLHLNIINKPVTILETTYDISIIVKFIYI